MLVLVFSQSESGHPAYGGAYQDGFNPSSPSAHFGRYREGSFGQQSGIESGRASTIGTDHSPSGLPHNSSRVALNNEWRNSYDQGSDPSRGMAISEIAPGKEGYGHAEPTYDDIAHEKGLIGGGQTYAPIPPSSPAVGALEKGAYPGGARDPPEVVISRTNRLDWIDGLRGIASVIIFAHHFSDLTWSQRYPNVLAEGSLEGILRFVALDSFWSLC